MSETTTGGTRAAVRVDASLDELLQHLTSRTTLSRSDALSGSRLESVERDGERMVLKVLCVDDDWIMRATGDIDSRALRLFSSTLPQRLPACIDHATVAVAAYRSRRGHRGAALLMRDVSSLLVPPGSKPITHESHRRFIEHMAELHAMFWGYVDTIDLTPLAHHFTILTPTMAALERERGTSEGVPVAVGNGWQQVATVDSTTAATLAQLAKDPSPLVTALARTPMTFVHGDWKLGNMGEHADGTTVLLDWDQCGAAPATYDLAWYLAVNCDRLPESKEDTIAAYRAALEQAGIATEPWWRQQLALTLLGAALQMAWSKTHDTAELGWWSERVREAEALLA